VAGPQRRPNGELTSASGRAHQEQIRHVEASDEKHEKYTRLQHVQGDTRVPHELLANRTRESRETARLHEVRVLRQAIQVPGDDRPHL
jgi:hypothetical protein